MKKSFVYYHCEKFDLDFYATLNTASTTQKRGIILYLHGGGLIYGNRDDLPNSYIKRFNEAGYSILSLDYPFIPEIKIDYLLNSLISGVKSLKNNSHLTNEPFDNVIYFGRSAGAYLVLQLAQSKELELPKKIISFYGYYSLDEPLINDSHSYYKTFPTVAFMTVQSLIKKKPLVQASIEDRFPIYLSYRQTGQWIKEVLGRRNKREAFSVTKDALNAFPPTFIAASKSDQDIPFSINEQLSQLIPNSETYFVENLPHDFDVNDQLETAISCYTSLINWLNKK